MEDVIEIKLCGFTAASQLGTVMRLIKGHSDVCALALGMCAATRMFSYFKLYFFTHIMVF